MGASLTLHRPPSFCQQRCSICQRSAVQPRPETNPHLFHRKHQVTAPTQRKGTKSIFFQGLEYGALRTTVSNGDHLVSRQCSQGWTRVVQATSNMQQAPSGGRGGKDAVIRLSRITENQGRQHQRFRNRSAFATDAPTMRQQTAVVRVNTSSSTASCTICIRQPPPNACAPAIDPADASSRQPRTKLLILASSGSQRVVSSVRVMDKGTSTPSTRFCKEGGMERGKIFSVLSLKCMRCDRGNT